MITQAELGFKLNCWPDNKERRALRYELLLSLTKAYESSDVSVYVYPFVDYENKNTILIEISLSLSLDDSVYHLYFIDTFVKDFFRKKGMLAE